MEQYLCSNTPSVVVATIGVAVHSAMPLAAEENLILVIGAIDPPGSLVSILIGKASEEIGKGEKP